MRIEREESKDWRKGLKNQSKEKALIKDLQKTDTFNPFSDESERTTHNLGCVSTLNYVKSLQRRKCSSCSKYWADGVVW